MPKESFEPQKPNFEFKGDHWVLPTDISLVDPATQEIEKRLTAAGWDPESTEVYFAQLGFDEALANAIAHGNLGVVKPKGSVVHIKNIAEEEQKLHPEKMKKIVDVKVNITRDKIEFIIRDQGAGFNPKEVEDPLAEENKLETKGRGLLLMNSFFEVTHITDDKGHEVRLLKVRSDEK